jgi:hypothetical protein
MATKSTSAGPARGKPFVGVGTTTAVAFVSAKKLYLERMNVLAVDGAGILCAELPEVGKIMPIAFRLSTARALVRCKAEVLEHIPTTPAGLEVRAKIGDAAFKSSVGAAIGDSATAIFRVADLEKAGAARHQPTGRSATATAAGFAVRFVEMEEASKAIVERHVATSRRLGEHLAARGDHLVATTDDEGEQIGALFDDGDLSKRAMDW